MQVKHNLKWQPSMNGIKTDASLDVVVHDSSSDTITLIVPGVDGSVDGYENKYVKMAENISEKLGHTVVRISNPFISSFHWEDNLTQALHFILEEKNSLSVKPKKINIIAHSAGASVSAWMANDYQEIKRLVLINMAEKLDKDRIVESLSNFDGEVILIYGSEDPSIEFGRQLSDDFLLKVVDDADHFFTDKLDDFINIPSNSLS